MTRPATYREQPACANCRYVVRDPDGYYCNKSNDRQRYPEWYAHDDAQFERARLWEVAHCVAVYGLCDEHKPRTPDARTE